jgi:hypothetical protein
MYRQLIYRGLAVVTIFIGLAILIQSATAQSRVGFDEVGRIDVPARRIVVQGGLAYATDGDCNPEGTPPVYICGGSFSILDVSNVATPTARGQLTSNEERFGATTVNGRYAYMVVEKVTYGNSDTRLAGIDVADPSAPREVASVALPFRGRQIQAVGDALYLAASDNKWGGLIVYDISDPLVPVETTRLFGIGSDMVLDGTKLYATGGRGLYILDVTTPTSPIELGVAEGRFTSVTVASNRAFVTEEGLCPPPYVDCRTFLVELDVSTPQNPTVVGTWTHIPAGTLHASAPYQNFLLVGASDGITAYDLNTPDRAKVANRRIMFNGMPGSVSSLQVQDDFIFIASMAHDQSASSIHVLRLSPRQAVLLPMIVW